ncbi:MAG: DUF5348 domain-containing protein [Lachnospiraceae bacterium]|nr:DUF5348 domain-containing protein [Lachnospiraceae bacterium]
MTKQGIMIYNPISQRMCIASAEYRYDLHCGDCIQIHIDGKWVETRLEMRWPGGEWYLVGLPDIDIVGARVRM